MSDIEKVAVDFFKAIIRYDDWIAFESATDFTFVQLQEYYKFLALKFATNDFSTETLSMLFHIFYLLELAPSRQVDEIWHFHILFTKHYRKFCHSICKAFKLHRRRLHHSPTTATQ